jgi:hypothetical protein
MMSRKIQSDAQKKTASKLTVFYALRQTFIRRELAFD